MNWEPWRGEVWAMGQERAVIDFLILTKRITGSPCFYPIR